MTWVLIAALPLICRVTEQIISPSWSLVSSPTDEEVISKLSEVPSGPDM